MAGNFHIPEQNIQVQTILVKLRTDIYARMDRKILPDEKITRHLHKVDTEENFTRLAKLGLHNIPCSQIPANVELNSGSSDTLFLKGSSRSDILFIQTSLDIRESH
jgi:hypothetical protein